MNAATYAETRRSTDSGTTGAQTFAEFTRAFSSAWVCARRPAFILPSIGALALFAVLMVVGIFLSAARPGGSRMSDTPIFLTDLAQADALSTLAGGMVSITGSCVLAVAAAHIAGVFASGSIRVQLVRQPRRRVWLAGQLGVVVVLSVLLTLVAVATTVVSAYVVAPMYGVSTELWRSGASWSALTTTTFNLTGCMVGFAMLGAVVAVYLRSAIAAIGVGLCYALFESLIGGVFGTAMRFLPAANLSAMAVGGNENVPYAWSLIGTLVVTALAAYLAGEIVRRRDVLD